MLYVCIVSLSCFVLFSGGAYMRSDVVDRLSKAQLGDTLAAGATGGGGGICGRDRECVSKHGFLKTYKTNS